MSISWEEHSKWASGMVEKADELGCSFEEAYTVTNVLMAFSGAPARVTRLATHCLEHMTELSEEIDRNIKANKEN